MTDADRPPAMRNMSIFLDGPALTGEEGTPQKLEAALSNLVASDVVQTASKILMSMESLAAKGVLGRQEEFVELFPPPLRRRILEQMAAAPGGQAALFYPQQLVALQRLAIVTSKPGPPTSFASGDQWEDFLRVCAWVGDVSTQLSGFTGHDDVDRRTIATWALRVGEANRLTFYRGAAGRAYQMWMNSDASWPEGLETVDEFCLRQFGLTYAAFVAIALAPAFARVNLRRPTPPDAIFVPEVYMATTRFDKEQVARVFAQLTYVAEHLRADDPATYWAFAELADRPYLPAPDPNLAASSVRFAFERATTSTFWMLHRAHAGSVGDFTTHFGAVFEDYCLRLAQSVGRADCVVRPELEYRDRKGNWVKTSDVLISEGGRCSPATTFVECRAVRPKRPLFEEGSLEAFDRYLEDLVGKLRQLDRVIGDYLERRFEVPDQIATGSDAIIPLLVVDQPFQWSPALRSLIEDAVKRNGWFRSPQVAFPIVCSISEYESLLHRVEQGEYLAEIGRAYISSGQTMPLEQFLFDTRGELEVPEMVNEGFRRLTDVVLGELKLPPDDEGRATK